MKNAPRWLVELALPPLAFFVIVVVAWQLATTIWEIPAYLVPGPGRVFDAARTRRGARVGHATDRAGALSGFGLGMLSGTILGLVFSQSRIIERSIYPYAIFLQTVPIVAIAPVLIMWFGHGFGGVVAVSFIVSLFPIITNATAGLTMVDVSLLELFEINNASRAQVLFKLRLPNAIGHLVTGAKISCGLSVIGAIVGEISAGFGTGGFGLGYLITTATGKLDTAYAFAAVICSARSSVAIFATVSSIGAMILARWHIAAPRSSTTNP